MSDEQRERSEDQEPAIEAPEAEIETKELEEKDLDKAAGGTWESYKPVP